MTRLIIAGSTTAISRQELRALFYAAQSVLEFHNAASIPQLFVILKPKGTMGKVHKGDKAGQDAAGTACWGELESKIQMRNDYGWSGSATLVIHELIHVMLRFGTGEAIGCHPDHCEKLTSTLTARLKPDVIRLANILVENTQQRAAYFAHTKISYKPDGDDFYDDEQYHDDHEESRGEKYRRATA